jgi:tripartite-type tricarboxylate transporter receptor subunit TctC
MPAWLRRSLERVARFALAAGVFALATSASADSFPSKPLKIVVPYPPGAITDALSRSLATELNKVLGQPVVVENKPGAGTLIGTQVAKGAPADGYTILFQLGTLVNNLYSYKQPGYELSDFTAISMLGQTSYALIVSTKYPFRSLQDLIKYGKERPGELNYSSTGAGAASVINSKLREASGLEWTEINYKGGAEATQAVMGGTVHFSLPTTAAPLIHVNPDKLRIVAVTSRKRLDFLPDVPTFTELGFPTLAEEAWFGLFIRSQTPQPVADKLKSAMAEVLKTPAMQEHLKTLRIAHYEGTLDEVPAKLQRELAEFIGQAKKLGFEPQ